MLNLLLPLFFFLIGAAAIPTPGLPLLNPGGIGGIFLGPNSETIIHGPDGSVITSANTGGKLATKLDPIIVAEPTIIQDEVPAVVNPDVATATNKIQTSDLSGPSGRIITEGSNSVVAGPASTTISKNGIVAETIPVINSIPVSVASATLPIINQETIAPASILLTPTPISISEASPLSVTPGPRDLSPISVTPLPISLTSPGVHETISVTPSPLAITSPNLFQPSPSPLSVTESSIALSNRVPDQLLSIPAATGLSLGLPQSNEQLLQVAQPNLLQGSVSIDNGVERGILNQNVRLSQNDEQLFQVAQPNLHQISSLSTNTRLVGGVLDQNLGSLSDGISQSTLLQNSALNNQVLEQSSTLGLNSLNTNNQQILTASPINLNGAISSTLSPVQISGLNPQQLTINDQLALDNRQLPINSGLISSSNVVPPEIGRPYVPSRTPEILTTPGLGASNPNIQREENIVNINAPLNRNILQVQSLSPQQLSLHLQNQQARLPNVQVSEQQNQVVDIRPRNELLLKQQQVAPTLASIQQQDLIGAQLLNAGVDPRQVQLTNVPLSQIQGVPIGLNDGLGLEAWGRTKRATNKRK